MYRELITGMTEHCAWANPQPPCPEETIAEAERCVGYPFPDELKALLREMNGDRWLLLSAEQMMEHVRVNRQLLSAWMEADVFETKVDRHIFFATNGCGDYYCYRILPDGTADDSAICLWKPETLETREVAKDLTELITKFYRDEF